MMSEEKSKRAKLKENYGIKQNFLQKNANLPHILSSYTLNLFKKFCCALRFALTRPKIPPPPPTASFRGDSVLQELILIRIRNTWTRVTTYTFVFQHMWDVRRLLNFTWLGIIVRLNNNPLSFSVNYPEIAKKPVRWWIQDNGSM